jgi:hypothetical protein
VRLALDGNREALRRAAPGIRVGDEVEITGGASFVSPAGHA